MWVPDAAHEPLRDERSKARIARLDPMTGESCVLSSMVHIRIAEGAHPAGWVPAVDEWVLSVLAKGQGISLFLQELHMGHLGGGLKACQDSTMAWVMAREVGSSRFALRFSISNKETLFFQCLAYI